MKTILISILALGLILPSCKKENSRSCKNAKIECERATFDYNDRVNSNNVHKVSDGKTARYAIINPDEMEFWKQRMDDSQQRVNSECY